MQNDLEQTLYAAIQLYSGTLQMELGMNTSTASRLSVLRTTNRVKGD